MTDIDINKYLNIARKNLKNANYEGTLDISERKGKKLKYTDESGKTIHFGSDTNFDKIIYFLKDGKDVAEQKAKIYRARAKKVFDKSDKLSPSHLAWFVLW
jgi:hypothetical protein